MIFTKETLIQMISELDTDNFEIEIEVTRSGNVKFFDDLTTDSKMGYKNTGEWLQTRDELIFHVKTYINLDTSPIGYTR